MQELFAHHPHVRGEAFKPIVVALIADCRPLEAVRHVGDHPAAETTVVEEDERWSVRRSERWKGVHRGARPREPLRERVLRTVARREADERRFPLGSHRRMKSERQLARARRGDVRMGNGRQDSADDDRHARNDEVVRGFESWIVCEGHEARELRHRLVTQHAMPGSRDLVRSRDRYEGAACTNNKKLGLKVEPISTQVIPRDRHAFYFSVLGIIAGSIERVAVEIRHLQRTEVYEMQEYFSKNQKGSSAMPHKKNPILSENLTGLSRMVRSAVIPALENIALWHERDISHSSVERNIGPDANITTDFALVRLTNILDNMIVYPKKMLENLNITKGLIFSQEVMLELTKSGLSREQSYKMVQNYAKKCFAENLDLFDVISSDKLIMSKITPKKLKSIFSYAKHFKNVNFIFRRVFK